MGLTAVDLAWIRDEIGTATPPTDDDLTALNDELNDRTLVAIRTLKRRRAAIAGGATIDAFTLTGVFSVSQKANLVALDSQIARLEALYAADTGLVVDDGAVTVGRLHRNDTRR